jgi:hypothetical protein
LLDICEKNAPIKVAQQNQNDSRAGEIQAVEESNHFWLDEA